MMINIPPTNILLIDDRSAGLPDLDIIVREFGASLMRTSTAQDALKQALNHEIAVILLDLDVPATSKSEVVDFIRAQPRSTSTPIILIAASDPGELSLDEARLQGPFDYLIKPVFPAMLRARLGLWIELYRKRVHIDRLEQEKRAAAGYGNDEQLRLILENTRDYAFIATDVEGRTTKWEGGAEAITGWPAQEAIGQPVAIIFTPEDRAAGRPATELICARETGRAEDKRWHLRKDGSRFFADGVMVSLKDADGNLHGFAKIFRDATIEREAADRVRTGEAKLQESRNLFSLLVESSAEGIYGMAADSSCMFLNAAGAEMLGYRPEELLGRHLHDIIHHHKADGSLYPPDECRLGLAAQSGTSVRVDDEVFWRKDGTPVPVSYSVSPMLKGEKYAGAVITFSNITERRQAEAERTRLLKEVQAASDRLVEIFEQAPAFMCVLRGPEFVFELVNARYLQFVGNRDVVGQPVRHAFPEVEGQGYFELLDRVYTTGEPFVGTGMPVLFQRTPGAPLEERFVDLVFTALRDADGVVTGVLVHGVDQTERMLAEAAEKASQARLRLASEATELGLWCWNPIDDEVVWENARPYEIFGVSPTDGSIDAARFIAELMHADDVAVFKQAIRRTVETGQRFYFEGRIVRPNGELHWVEFFGDMQSAKDGTPPQLIGTMRDITSRKLAEIDLHESRERFQKIVSQAATGVVQADTDGCITLVNQKFCAMLGYTEADLIGTNVLDTIAPDSLPKTLAALGELKSTGTGFVIEKKYRRKDGSLMWATSSVNALRGPDNELQGLVAIVVDITDSKRAAEELRASEERYRTLFTSMDQGFCIIEMMFDSAGVAVDYRFVEMNPMFESQIGLTNVINKTVRELGPDLDRFWIDTYEQVAITGTPVRFEKEAKALQRWFDVYATRVGRPDSKKVALLFSDITARKQADEHLRLLAADLADADRRKTEFLATLAHELRNPMAPIRSGLELLRLTGDSPAKVTRIREMMDRQVTQMVRLIDDLLDIARISGGKLELQKERVDMKDILTGAVETSLPLIEAGKHELHVEVPDTPLPVDVDATRIGQVISNLLNNAAKYTPSGGRIALSVQLAANDVTISITDNGLGIPAKSLTSIFDMFNQVGCNIERAQGGLGIGLALVRRLVEMHGGTVTGTSAGIGHGSTFVVCLPLAQSGAPDPSCAPLSTREAQQPGTRKLKILVVDDNADAAETLSAILELGGHMTRVANDGIQGLQAAKEFVPDVAFLDIGMPGMNGYEVAQALRTMPGLKHIMLVALTGWGATNDRARAKDAGFDYHLTKPAEHRAVEVLLAQLADALAANSHKLHVV